MITDSVWFRHLPDPVSIKGWFIDSRRVSPFEANHYWVENIYYLAQLIE